MFVSPGIAGQAYDCVVIGSGPAGLTVGLALADANRKVLILESGYEDRPRTDLARCLGYGHFSGDYWNGHSIRALGGTSSVWTGWCTTLTDLDFDNPAVGVRWPLSRDELLPYWRRAAPILDHNPAFIDFERPLVPGLVYRPTPTEPPTRFAEKYGETLRTSTNIGVSPGCTVVGLDANAARSAVTHVRYLDARSSTPQTLPVHAAQTVVVAAGGIGNAQLLLQPRSDGGVPVGNESGLAGRYLMEHPHFTDAGECVLDVELDRYWPAENTGTGVHALKVDRALSLEQGLFACSWQCARKSPDHELARHLSREAGRPFFHYQMNARAEMLPSAANHVFLTGERDAAGLYRPAARCVLDARDFENAERTLRVMGARLIETGHGRVRINNDRIYKDASGGGHILGATRMGDDRSQSVVDRDCRVHGYANLFVAGSSVFPTGGCANPTLTIVALALRLADRLTKESTRT
jgi:choline dehydrogenase-like flavoprotein